MDGQKGELFGEASWKLAIVSQEMEDEPLRRFLSDARQTREEVHELREAFG